MYIEPSSFTADLESYLHTVGASKGQGDCPANRNLQVIYMIGNEMSIEELEQDY